MRLYKSFSLLLCLISLAACGGGGGGGSSSDSDTTSPAVSITAPASGATVIGSTTVTASASDNVGVARVEFYANETLQSSDSSAPYSFDWNTLLLTDGPYILKALAYDAAGNSAPSSNVTVTVAHDTILPSVSIISPANGTVSGTVNIAASASDNTAISKVEFFVNDVLQGTDSTAPYSHSWNTTVLVRGNYTLTAKAYDTANNVQQSAGVVVTVPISTSMSTVLSGTTAVGTVTIYGIAVPDAYGFDFTVTMPPGARIASVASSGSYATTGITFNSGPDAVTHANSNVGTGEIMVVNFADVPASATAASFGISLSAVFDGAGVQIQ